MQSHTKRRLSPEELDALVGCRLEAELTDGWFNTAYRVVLDDGRAAVVKLAPPADVQVLRYERGIMATEAMVYRRIAALPDVPAPELLRAGPEFLAISLLEGTPWDKAIDLPEDTQRALRRELGAVTARLHTLTSEEFGYPAAESALSAPDWKTAFIAMVDALLDDAERWHSDLSATPAEIRGLVLKGGDALDEVTTPALIHFDLWPGNIFIDGSRIVGLIDHERAFWGDPAAELVSLAFGGDTGPDSDLVRGYVEAGGVLDFTPAFRHRLALYQLYLSLLLIIECGPRGYDDANHLAFCRDFHADALARLRELG
ncbi:aminoglycoside phosphotransferase family protein [Lentzea sp. PSKA42]|uniref:Aminoglycoside phosphotransferase family protein n=1 Tax=Lentzea indica TaxID=2604800 RepID=A0ABX1FFN3_9PSEU|nr:aminoglycoside phosphotransferase family protein [Lentzea indica]NKE57771.1 aminoglycoside phosphotransferase family protein [Lentzea indica]